MAKKKAASAKTRKRQVSEWAGDARERNIDAMFDSMRYAAKNSLGRDDITVGTEAERMLVGLPLPALCLRYVFQSNIFPLSRVLQLAGPQGSCKSAFLYELFRWHCTYGGGACLAECENKDAAMMRNGVLQRNSLWLSRMTVGPANAMEEWQRFLTTNLQLFRGAMDAPGGPGRTIPICFGIDSLTAVDTQGNIDKTAEAGHASLGFAQLANLIARYMRQAVVPNLRGYPFTIVGTNHLKHKIDAASRPGMPPATTAPGGDAVPFMATFLIETNRIADINTSDYEGVRIKIKMAKNNLGAPRKAIEADFLWWQRMLEDGNWQQEFAWDWDAASIDLLLRFKTIKGRTTLYNNLMSIVDLHTESGKRVWSKALGIASKEPVPYRTAGWMLEQRPDLLEQLYPLLGINRYSYFQPGLDYRHMLEQAKQQGVTESATLYSKPEDLMQLSASQLDPLGKVETTITEEDEEPHAGSE